MNAITPTPWASPGDWGEPDPQDLVGALTMRGAFTAVMHEVHGRAGWVLEGTSMAADGAVPETITVRDYLTVIGNLATRSPDPGYFVDYLLTGVPMFYGSLEQALYFAPTMSAAIDLMMRYGPDRPGYHAYRRLSGDGRQGIEFVAMTRLGEARRMVAELPGLFLARLATRFRGRPVADTVIELRHGPGPYADRLQRTAGCEIRYGAPRDAVTLPDDAASRANVAYDGDLWRIFSTRCADEVSKVGDRQPLSRVRRLMAERFGQSGRAPRLQDIAGTLGISPRTLIRRLTAAGVTYQSLLDELLYGQAQIMLADPSLGSARIAELLGFSDASGFYRSFRRWSGMTPAEYRRSVTSSVTTGQ